MLEWEYMPRPNTANVSLPCLLSYQKESNTCTSLSLQRANHMSKLCKILSSKLKKRTIANSCHVLPMYGLSFQGRQKITSQTELLLIPHITLGDQ